MLVVDRAGSHLVAAMLLLVPAGAAVIALSAHSRLTGSNSVGAGAEREAHRLALWVLLFAVGLALPRPAVGNVASLLRRLPRRVAVGSVAAAAIGAVTVLVVHLGAHFFAAGYRASYWHVAWTEYAAHPWLGSGAGTFGSYWLRYGIPGVAGGALDAHNLYLETLAELGPLGLALLAGVLGLPLVSAVRARSDVFTSAAAGAYVAIVAHAALDWDWEMPAVMLAGFVCAAAIVAARRPDVRTHAPGTWARSTALALVVSLAVFALLAQFVAALGGDGPHY
jgi:O-antigen ligase